MKNKICATLIFRLKKEDYEGNNFFFGQVCEQLDGQRLTVQNISCKGSNGAEGFFHKVSVEVSAEAEENKSDECLRDEQEVSEWLNEKVEASNLSSAYLILVDTANTEFSELEVA